MSRQRTIALLALAVVLAGAAAYAPALRNGFVNLDDPQILLDNPAIRGLSGPHLGGIFGSSYGGLGGYTPLVLVTYALEYRLFGLDASAFHGTNLLLHVINCLLVFGLMVLATGDLRMGFLTALIFAVHPLHAEPVAWIQGRKDLLFSFFFLAGLLVYARDIRKGRRPARYFLALALFAMAALSKIAAVSFPLIILLLERRMTGRMDRQAIRKTVPFWAVSGAVALLAFTTHEPMLSGGTAAAPDVWGSLAKFFYAFAFYAKRVVVPLGLTPGYAGRPGVPIGDTAVALAVLAGLVLALWMAYRRRPEDVTFGVGWALLTLLPTLPFHFFGQPYEDRYMYLPLAGLVFAVSALVPAAARSGPRRFKKAALLGAPLFVVVATMILLSRDQCRVWRDSLSLWDHAIAVEPFNPLGYMNRAETMFQQGRFPQALADYGQARELMPQDARSWLGLASVHFRMGEPETALQELNRSLELNPLYYEAYIARGLFWGNVRAFDHSVRDFTAALALTKTAEAYYYRALAYLELKRPDLALDDLRAAYRLNPTGDIAARIAQLTKAKRP